MLGEDYKIFGFMYPYGLCMAVGIILCFVFLMFTTRKRNFNEEAADKLIFIGIFATLFGILMAAIVQGIYNVIAGGKFDLGSMTFLGGLIGGVGGFLIVWNLFVFVVAPRANNSQNKLVVKLFGDHMNASLADALPFIPPAITIAHAFGRLGCTLAGCCYGKETDAWYGIFMHTEKFGYAKVIPTQLFECIFLLVLSAVMIVLFFRFNFKCNFAVYLMAYGIWRFLIEFIRADYRGGVQGALLSPSQILSLVMVPLGVGYIFLQKYVLSRFMRHPELQPSVREEKKETSENAQTPADE